MVLTKSFDGASAQQAANMKSHLVSDDEGSDKDQRIVSKSSQRRVSTFRTILIVKLPVPMTAPSQPSDQRPPDAAPPEEGPHHKRPDCENGQEPRAMPFKKARVSVVLPPAGASTERRMVHFEFEFQDNQVVIKTHVRVFDRVEDSDVANIWWSGEEMLEILTREKSAVSVMAFCCDHYAAEVLNLMKMARDKASMPGRATSESASPVWVASSPARGLERDIVKGFKQRKRQVIRKVLESQRALKAGRHQVTGGRAPPELQSQLLSTQYEKWSQPMLRFAQVLAEGDAQVVLDNSTCTMASL